jgi:signal transduction histidine kinase
LNQLSAKKRNGLTLEIFRRSFQSLIRFFSVFFLIFSFGIGCNFGKPDTSILEDGTVEVKKFIPTRSFSIILKDNWEYFPKVTPKTYFSQNPEPTRITSLPRVENEPYGAYRIRLRIRENNPLEFGIRIIRVYFYYHVYIDGVPIAQEGTIDEDDPHPFYYSSKVYQFIPTKPVTEIVIFFKNPYGFRGGFRSPIEIGEVHRILFLKSFHIIADAILIGSILTIIFFLMVSESSFNKKPEVKWFLFLCIIMMIRTQFNNEKFIFRIIEWGPIVFVKKGTAILDLLASGFFFMYCRMISDRFKEDLPKFITRLTFFSTGIILFLPLDYLIMWEEIYFAWIILSMIVMGYYIISSYFEKNPGYHYMITSAAILLLTTIIEIISFLVKSDSSYIHQLGLILFLMYQATYISKNTTDELYQYRLQTIQKYKMSFLGEIVAGVTHEINSPLGAILSSGELIDNEFKQFNKIYSEFNDKQSKIDINNYNEILNKFTIHHSNKINSIEEKKLKMEFINKMDKDKWPNFINISDAIFKLRPQTIEDAFFIYDKLPQKQTIEFLELIYLHKSILDQSNLVVRSSSMIMKLVNSLMKFTYVMPERNKISTSLTDGIETVLSIYQFRLKHNIEVIKNYQFNKMIFAQPDDLIQVWTNLIGNSIQAMDGKGILKIDVVEEEEEILVSIEDSGAGIPDEIQTKIFDPYFTTKSMGKGTGLGLFIVKKIIDEHQSKIDLSSGPGYTKFIVRLSKKFALVP